MMTRLFVTSVIGKTARFTCDSNFLIQVNPISLKSRFLRFAHDVVFFHMMSCDIIYNKYSRHIGVYSSSVDVLLESSGARMISECVRPSKHVYRAVPSADPRLALPMFQQTMRQQPRTLGNTVAPASASDVCRRHVVAFTVSEGDQWAQLPFAGRYISEGIDEES